MDAPHLPRQVPIDAHGGGGFRFGGMSHRGSLLCLPEGIWAWPVAAPEAIDDEALSMVFARAGNLDFFILGTGAVLRPLSERLRLRFREAHISADAMATAPALHTYNVMLMENRRVGAGLIAAG